MIPPIPNTPEVFDLIVGALFALVGVLLFLLMLVSKIVRFTLNLVNTYLPKKAKFRMEVSTKSLYVPLVGVCFIITLALAARNWFIYGVAIIIIATLVTELQFLEKIVALFWDRKEYWDYLAQSTAKTQSVTNPTAEQKKQLETAAIQESNHDQQSNANEVQNELLLMYHSERMYRLIFGSQIGILQWLELSPQGLTKSQIADAYRQNPISASYPLENYLGFLENNRLIQFNPESGTYHITPVGKYFLEYLVKNQLSSNKPN